MKLAVNITAHGYRAFLRFVSVPDVVGRLSMREAAHNAFGKIKTRDIPQVERSIRPGAPLAPTADSLLELMALKW